MAADQAHPTHQESSILAVRTKPRFEAVITLKNEGKGIDAILRQFGLAWETVRRFYDTSSVDELLRAPRAGRPTLLDEFAVHLHERFNDGCIAAAALYEELQASGYRGSYSSDRDYLRPFRRIGPAPPSAPKVPKVRRITSWMLRASRQPYRRRADLAHAGSRQLPTSRSNCRACHIVRGDAHRTPWRTIELVDVSRRSR